MPPSRAYSTTYAQVLQCVAKCYKVSHIVTQCYEVVQSACMFFLTIFTSRSLWARATTCRSASHAWHCTGPGPSFCTVEAIRLSQSCFKVVIARALALTLWKSSRSSWTSARCQSEGGVEHLVVVIAKERSTWQFFPNFATFAQLGNFCPSILPW